MAAGAETKCRGDQLQIQVKSSPEILHSSWLILRTWQPLLSPPKSTATQYHLDSFLSLILLQSLFILPLPEEESCLLPAPCMWFPPPTITFLVPDSVVPFSLVPSLRGHKPLHSLTLFAPLSFAIPLSYSFPGHRYTLLATLTALCPGHHPLSANNQAGTEAKSKGKEPLG